MRIPAFLRLCFVFSVSLAAFGISFERNLGQTGAGIRYLARTQSGAIFITDSGATPGFELSGANWNTEWQPQSATAETFSYFIGRDPSKWIHDAPHYEQLLRREVYPGIDLLLYGNGNQLEYDFLLAPRADPGQIRLKVTGEVSLAPDGSLVVTSPEGELRHRKPVLMETLPDGTRREVAGAFRILEDGEVGFAVGRHDLNLPLSIDPVLESSTYFGGTEDDQVIATDGAILVGNTTSIGLPGAPYARRKGTNTFLTQGNSTMVFGGSGNTTATSVVIVPYPSNGQFTVAIGGYTDAADLPTNLPNPNNAQPLQANYGGGATDGFLVIIYPPRYVALTYVGGPGTDKITGLAQSYGQLAIVGTTDQGGLPFTLYGPQFQAAPAGGLDGFLLNAYPFLYTPLQLSTSTYLGGSGDDTILGVAIAGGICYVTGETKSPDFPLKNALYSKRSGSSDAFIAELPNCGPGIAASTLFGGKDSERGVALSILSGGDVVLAGVTSSTDLPLQNPHQKTYGGGVSDAFVARFTNTLSKLVSSTYIGGSDADEATSVATGFTSTIFVGGWTASHNFPTVNALQKQYGGGPDDGFLVHFDDDASVYQQTYFGGSGSDRVLGLSAASAGATVWLSGETTSPNLPLKNPDQSSLHGGLDGFVAEVTANLISVSPFSGAKDLRGAWNVAFGNTPLAATTSFTVSSSDASKVLVATDTTSPGAKSVKFGYQNQFYIDCLTGSGGANLTISGAAYASRAFPVTCFPEAVFVSGYSAADPIQTHIGPGGVFLISIFAGPDAPNATPYPGAFFPQPGVAPITVSIASSNPTVGVPSTSSATLGNPSQQQCTFTPLAIGKADLTFNAGSVPIRPSDTLHVNVAGSYTVPVSIVIPSGFQGSFSPSYVAAAITLPGLPTITSSDPSKVAISASPQQPGSTKVTLTNTQNQVWIQALAPSGDYKLKISVPGEPDLTTTVHITTPVLNLVAGTRQPLHLPIGGTANLSFYILGAEPVTAYDLYLNPHASPITFTLQTSNSKAVKISPATFKVGPGASASGGFQITGVAEGSAILTLPNTGKIPINGPVTSVSVNVDKKLNVLAIHDLELGKDLMDLMTVTLPVPLAADTLVTASVSDPTLAVLSLDPNNSGLQQITAVVPAGGGSWGFYVQGLASSGQATVTVTQPGYSPVTAAVKLDGSGFYWTASSAAPNVGPTAIAVGPLDSNSLLPVGHQSLRPGVTFSLSITSSNSKVAAVSPNPITTLGSNYTIAGTSPGTATLTMHQPAGFTKPSAGQTLAVTVQQPGLSIGSLTLAKNTQGQLYVTGPQGVAVTVTSSDPSKVRLSTDQNKRGSGSVTVTAQLIFVQALADSGIVTLKATAPNTTSASSSVTLSHLGLSIGIATTSGVSFDNNGKAHTTTQSEALTITVGFCAPQGSGQAMFLPGLAPLTAKISSSSPGVAVITGSPVTIPQNSNPSQSPTAQLLQVSPGETTISISQPPGFSCSYPGDRVVLDVAAPSLSAPNLQVAKDTVSQTYIVTAPLVKSPSVATPVTVTSSDPSRILLSPDASTPPSASTVVTLPPASTGGGGALINVYSLSDNGTVAINYTAPGFPAGSITVQLFPLAFGFSGDQGSPINALIQGGPRQVHLTASPLLPNGQLISAVSFRPGIPPITIGVTSSAPGTVSVNPSQIVFSNDSSLNSINFTPLRSGTATLGLKVPAGYAVSPTTGKLAIVVDEDTLNAGANALSLPLGRDLQTSLAVSWGTPSNNMSIKVTSSNPSILLVSPNATTPGQPNATISVFDLNTTAIVYVQALAGSGTATLTFSSPGFHSATRQVTLTPTGAVFPLLNYEVNVLTSAGPQTQTVALASLDPVTLKASGATYLPRPGVTLSVPVTSSDPKILAVTHREIRRGSNRGHSRECIVPAGGPGTAVVKLGVLPGNPMSSTETELVYTVSEAALSIPSFTLGNVLEGPLQVKLGSMAPTPTADTTISVFAPYTMSLSANASDPGQYMLPVTIPAGQRASKIFYVQGIGPGTAAIGYGGGAFQNFSTPATVTNTAFVIQEAAGGQSLNLKVGDTAKLTIVPETSPPSDNALSPLIIRPGVQPITVVTASTDPNVASVSPPQATLNPGDHQAIITVKALAAGTTTIKLLGDQYDFGQPQASISVVVK